MVNSTNEKNNIIIFCQAPADIPYVLTIYEKYHCTNSISIYVVNVEAMFEFLQNLNLDLEEFVYIPYSLKSLKKINEVVAEKKRIRFLYEKYFHHVDNAHVYFFSKYEDWLTAAFISRLSKKRTVVINYLGHYDNLGELYKSTSTISLKITLYLFILKYITNIWFKANIVKILPEFPFLNYGIKEVSLDVDKNVFIKYQYNFSLFKSEKIKVIMYISPCEATIFDSTKYDILLTEIIELLKEIGFCFFVKGHPRLGLPNSIKDIVDFVIPSYIPGEFIKNDIFSLCLGIDTTVITHYAKHENLATYSLVKIFPASDVNLHNIAIEYLKQQSDNKMEFCDSMDDLYIKALNIKTISC